MTRLLPAPYLGLVSRKYAPHTRRFLSWANPPIRCFRRLGNSGRLLRTPRLICCAACAFKRAIRCGLFPIRRFPLPIISPSRRCVCTRSNRKSPAALEPWAVLMRSVSYVPTSSRYANNKLISFSLWCYHSKAVRLSLVSTADCFKQTVGASQLLFIKSSLFCLH